MRPALLTCQTALCLTLVLALPAEVKAQGLNAAEVWSSWQEATKAAGGSLTGQTRREGTRLVIENIALRPSSQPYPAILMESLSLMGQADGSVRVESPESFPLRIEVPSEEHGSATVTLSVTSQSSIVALFGLGKKAELAAQIPQITVSLADISPLSPDLPLPEMTLVLDHLGLRYKHDIASAAPSFDGAMQLAGLSLSFKGGEDDSAFSNLWQMKDIKLEGLGKFPASIQGLLQGAKLRNHLAGVNPSQFPLPALITALKDGLTLNLTGKIGATEISLMTQQEGAKIDAGFTLTSGEAAFKFNQTEIASHASAHDFALTTLIGEAEGAPKTQQISGEVLSFKASSGLNDLRGPQNWVLNLISKNLTLDDAIWSLLLPSAEVSNEPINLVLDASGSYGIDPAMLSAPSLLPSQTAPSTSDLYFNHFAFTLNTLEAQGLGVKLDGKGGLTFDFADPSFIGYPMPSGKLAFSLIGINRLIDQLAKMGALSPEQAIQARLSLPMIAKPGENPDSYTSDLDFRDKSFYLNGTKLR